jgi:hypothetical protein
VAERTFDPTSILSDDAFTDFRAMSATTIQQFFAKSPYARSSFLETYQSNGFRASVAVERAAEQYAINPLVLLVRLQTDGGLVGEPVYPQPPNRVEYVFGCGCASPDRCDAAYAGLDRQLACLGMELRTAFDAVSANGATPRGWGPGREGRTTDGQTVMPADGATSVLYDQSPTVGVGKPVGTWVFWNIFQAYSDAADYLPPLGGGGRGWVGDRCTKDSDCGFDGAFCDTLFPGGACTADCAQARCPSESAKPATFCADLQDASLCLVECTPNVVGSCRAGLECRTAARGGSEGPTRAFVCQVPAE